VVPSDKLLLSSSIALFKLPSACGTFCFDFTPASAGGVGSPDDGPLRRKPINLWIRGQCTKDHQKTHSPRLLFVAPG
jgi:hypothetical protein